MIDVERLHPRVLERMDLEDEITDGQLQEIIYSVIKEYGKEEYLSIKERAQMGKDLFNTFRKLDLLQELIEDDNITEIMINGTSNIFVEQGGRITELDKRFWSRKKLEDVIQQIVSTTNRIVNESTPIVDARLEDGSRVNVVLYPVALNGPIVTIRKFSKDRITMDKLMEWNAINKEVVELLKVLVKSRYNIFISGGTGSGKTTFLNALSAFIPTDERIITIEDNAELQITNIPNLVTMESRMANIEGEGAIAIRDLIRTSLRMRPNRIIVGEVRGEEAIDMLMAMNTGHDGSLSTAHANTTMDMLGRLETMVLMGMDLPLGAVRRQIASGIDIMVHVGRLRDGSRKVLEVSEVIGYVTTTEQIQLRTLYRFEEGMEENGKVHGTWVYENPIYHREKLLAAGYENNRDHTSRHKRNSHS